MQHIEKTIDVDAPVSMVYNQWTQFEEFPEFMDGVESVKQLDDKRLHWRANIGGKIKEWDAEIFEQVPDQRIAWRSMSGPTNTGRVEFESLGAGQTRLTVHLNYEPQTAIEAIGGAIGVLGGKIEGDLVRFKKFIESRGSETGAWRGEIRGKQVEREGSMGGAAEAMPRSKRLNTKI